jgi:hypothetical protein
VWYFYTAGHAMALVDGQLVDTQFEEGSDLRRIQGMYRIIDKRTASVANRDIPSSLFHATRPENLSSIMSSGLRRGFEGVYMANTAGYAAGFVAMRSNIIGMEEVEYGGQTFQVPKLGDESTVYALEIDVADLDLSKLHDSHDHAAGMVPADLESYVYDGDIPASAIIDVYEIEL